LSSPAGPESAAKKKASPPMSVTKKNAASFRR